MAKDRKKSRTGKASTDWGAWEYDPDKLCYVTSRINRDGVKEIMCGGECEPPVAQTEGLEERIGQISLSPDEPEPGGDEVAVQGGRLLQPLSSNGTPSLQLPTVPYASRPGSMSYSQGQGRGYSSGNGMAQYGNTAPNGPVSTGYNSGYGRGQVQVGTWHSSTNNGAGSIFGNAITQPYADTTQTTTYNFRGSPPTGPANNTQRNQGRRRNGSQAKFSIVKAKDTETDFSSKSNLWKEFQVLHSSEFKERRVFKVVWTEPHSNGGQGGGENNSNYSKVTQTKHGELGYTSIRRFVVWKNYEGHALCLPILTYGKRGTTKPGVKSAHHAIIFTESKSASPLRSIMHPPREVNGELQLPNAPVCVELMNPRNQLDVMSRLNYAKVYTVEHNIRVSFIGRIHQDSVKEFQAAYDRIQNGTDSSAGSVVDGEMDGGDDGAGAVAQNVHPSNRKYEY